MMKIDAFTHIYPPKYKALVEKKLDIKVALNFDMITKCFPTLYDMDTRFKVQDKFDVMHILTLTTPFIEKTARPKEYCIKCDPYRSKERGQRWRKRKGSVQIISEVP